MLEGTIAAVDGEKDPRCLLLAFRCVAAAAQLFLAPGVDPEPLRQAAAELADVLSCYFPIQYSPPAGLAGAVGREELVAALAAAMASAPQLAEHVVRPRPAAAGRPARARPPAPQRGAADRSGTPGLPLRRCRCCWRSCPLRWRAPSRTRWARCRPAAPGTALPRCSRTSARWVAPPLLRGAGAAQGAAGAGAGAAHGALPLGPRWRATCRFALPLHAAVARGQGGDHHSG